MTKFSCCRGFHTSALLEFPTWKAQGNDLEEMCRSASNDWCHTTFPMFSQRPRKMYTTEHQTSCANSRMWHSLNQWHGRNNMGKCHCDLRKEVTQRNVSVVSNDWCRTTTFPQLSHRRKKMRANEHQTSCVNSRMCDSPNQRHGRYNMRKVHISSEYESCGPDGSAAPTV